VANSEIETASATTVINLYVVKHVPGEEARGCFLVWDDRVVEYNRHRHLLQDDADEQSRPSADGNCL
jgi:hypothetical protein